MAYTQEQINQAFASSKEKGLSDQQINEIANNIGLTEQNILNARNWWLDTPAGQNYLSGATPLQQEWANTFWVGDMAGAQNILNREKLTPQRLVTEYNVNPTEISNITNRYGVVPFGGQAATAPPTNPTDQQQGGGGNGTGFGMWTIPDAQNPSFSYGPTTAEAGGWANRFTAGASDKAGLGNAGAYQSNVIQALRQASSQTPFSTNAGVSIIPNLTSRTPAVFVPGKNLAFNPPIIKGKTAGSVVDTGNGTGVSRGDGVQPGGGTIGGGSAIGGGATGGATGATGAGGTTGTGGTSTGTAGGSAAALPTNTGTNTNLITLPAIGSTDTKTPSVELRQDLETSNASAIPWDENEKFGLDQELGFIQQSDVPERGTAAFPQDFGYINPSDVPVVDRSVPAGSDANWGMASGSLLPDWAVDAAFGIKSATENPLVKTVFPLASAVGGSVADAGLDAQIERLVNQYNAIQTGNNLGYGTRVDGSGAVFYEAPVETRDVYSNLIGGTSGGGGGTMGFGWLDRPLQIEHN